MLLINTCITVILALINFVCKFPPSAINKFRAFKGFGLYIQIWDSERAPGIVRGDGFSECYHYCTWFGSVCDSLHVLLLWSQTWADSVRPQMQLYSSLITNRTFLVTNLGWQQYIVYQQCNFNSLIDNGTLLVTNLEPTTIDWQCSYISVIDIAALLVTNLEPTMIDLLCNIDIATFLVTNLKPTTIDRQHNYISFIDDATLLVTNLKQTSEDL